MAAVYRQRARAITVVAGKRRLAVENRQCVDRHDGGLLARGCGSLRIGGVATIAQCKDLRIARVAQCRGINLRIPAGICERTGGNNRIGRLRGNRVQHVEAAGDLALGGAERRLPRRAIDRNEVGAESQVDAVTLHRLHQRRHIVGHTEQRRPGIVEFHLDAAQRAAAAPLAAREVHGLLRRTRAFDRHGRLREQRPSPTRRPHQFPGIGRQIVAIVRRHPELAERGFQAVDGFPCQAIAHGNDEHFVGQPGAVIEQDRLAIRVKADATRMDPLRALRHDLAGRPHGVARLEHAATDHRPARLVIVLLARFDDGDIQTLAALEQRGGGGDSRRSAADNHHTVMP